MANVKEIYQFMDQIAPFHTQEGFDNAGFLVGREGAQVSKILVSLDITEQVVEEARRVADGFVKKRQRKWFQHIPATGYMILGAVIATVVCCLTFGV